MQDKRGGEGMTVSVCVSAFFCICVKVSFSACVGVHMHVYDCMCASKPKLQRQKISEREKQNEKVNEGGGESRGESSKPSL